jgi:hypothetical protein
MMAVPATGTIVEANGPVQRNLVVAHDDDDDDDDDDDLKQKIITEKKTLAAEKQKYKHESNPTLKKEEKKEYKAEKRHVEAMEVEYEKEYNAPDKYAAYEKDGYTKDKPKKQNYAGKLESLRSNTFHSYQAKVGTPSPTPICPRNADGCIIKCSIPDKAVGVLLRTRNTIH